MTVKMVIVALSNDRGMESRGLGGEGVRRKRLV